MPTPAQATSMPSRLCRRIDSPAPHFEIWCSESPDRATPSSTSAPDPASMPASMASAVLGSAPMTSIQTCAISSPFIAERSSRPGESRYGRDRIRISSQTTPRKHPDRRGSRHRELRAPESRRGSAESVSEVPHPDGTRRQSAGECAESVFRGGPQVSLVVVELRAAVAQGTFRRAWRAWADRTPSSRRLRRAMRAAFCIEARLPRPPLTSRPARGRYRYGSTRRPCLAANDDLSIHVSAVRKDG